MKRLKFEKGEHIMKQINESEIKHLLHTNINSNHSSVSFEHVWEKYSNKKSGRNHNRIYRKRIIIIPILGLLCVFAIFQSPVRAFIEQFIEVKLIKNVKNAEFGFAWANTAGDTRSIVLNKEEAVKSLGISLPWPNELDKMTGEREIRTRKERNKPLGYDYTIRTNHRYYQVIANYKINTHPEFYTETTGKAIVKELSIQGGSAKLITTTEYNNVPHIYFEKGDWQIVIKVTDHAKEEMSEQKIIELAESIK